MEAKMLWVAREAEPRLLPPKPHLATPRNRMSCGMVRILDISGVRLCSFYIKTSPADYEILDVTDIEMSSRPHRLVHLTFDVTFAKFNCEIKKQVSGSVVLLFSFY